MRIFLRSALLFSLSLKAIGACDFKSTVSGVVSLSGTTTVLFKELGLLQHSKLKGISIFNPVGEKDFKGKIYPGGVFLSNNTLGEFAGQIVFYDESRELNRILSPRSSVWAREVKTRNLTPKEAVVKTLTLMEEHLQGCETEIAKVQQKVFDLESGLKKKLPKDLFVIFYLGEFRGGKAPELVISNDGIVKWMKDQKIIRTYPSELAYVNWSAKIMSELPKNTLQVGVKDSGRDGDQEIKRSSEKMTLVYPGSLVPGISQLEAFVYWARTTF